MFPRVCVMYSGGKDSTYALHWAILHGFRVECLGTILPKRLDSMLFHYPAVELTMLQAKSMGFRHVKLESSDNEYNSLLELFEVFKKLGVDGVVVGVLLSDYQRLKFSMAAEETNLKIYTPLWRKDQEEYMRSLVREGFKFIIVSIQAYGIPEKFLGRILTSRDVEEIIKLARTYGFNPSFEGGEAETLVVDAPLFRYKLRVYGTPRRIAPHSYIYDIHTVKLVPKHSFKTMNDREYHA